MEDTNLVSCNQLHDVILNTSLHTTDDLTLEQAKEIISELKKDNFLLKKKLEEKNCVCIKALCFGKELDSENNINNLFDKIYYCYLINNDTNNNTNGYLNCLEKINGGESLKKLFKLTIGSNNYLFADFADAVETAEDFVVVSNHFKDEKYCLPKIYYHRGNIVISEYVEKTLGNIICTTVKHCLIKTIYLQSIDWIINFKQSNFQSKNKTQSLEISKQIHLDVINKLFTYANVNNQYNLTKVKHFIDQVYSETNCFCHNNFQIMNILWLDSEQSIKIIDYQDCGYNIEHYDVVSLIYSLKTYLTEIERCTLLSYYYEKLNCMYSYEHFISIIIKTEFVRVCKSLEVRFRKFMNGNVDLLLLIEIRRGLAYISQIESYIGISISSDLEKLLPENNIVSIVLCAGKGTRMLTDLPKCAVNILDKPMITYVSNTLNTIRANKNIYVVGYKKESVINIINNYSESSTTVFVNQDQLMGTGHAVIQAIPQIKDNKIVIVAMGDMPTLTQSILNNLLHLHNTSFATSTIVTKVFINNKTNEQSNIQSGRIIRNKKTNEFEKIVEAKDIFFLPDLEAEHVRTITEVNTGIYVFNSTELKKYLLKLDNKNAQNEYYLTDIFKLQKLDGHKIECFTVTDLVEPSGANTPEELKQIEMIFSEII